MRIPRSDSLSLEKNGMCNIDEGFQDKTLGIGCHRWMLKLHHTPNTYDKTVRGIPTKKASMNFSPQLDKYISN